MKNGNTSIRPLHGMFSQTTQIFNAGWDHSGKRIANAEDVRHIKKRLRKAGMATGAEIESTREPAGFTSLDPNGNPIVIDQHV